MKVNMYKTIAKVKYNGKQLPVGTFVLPATAKIIGMENCVPLDSAGRELKVTPPVMPVTPDAKTTEFNKAERFKDTETGSRTAKVFDKDSGKLVDEAPKKAKKPTSNKVEVAPVVIVPEEAPKPRVVKEKAEANVPSPPVTKTPATPKPAEKPVEKPVEKKKKVAEKAKEKPAPSFDVSAPAEEKPKKKRASKAKKTEDNK